MPTVHFDHEKLRAYQQALRFIVFVQTVIDDMPSKLAARDQLDRASTSIALNIAEGNGKRSPVDRCRFLDMARGSALECAACLDVMGVRGHLACERIEEGKQILVGIVSMLVGLLQSLGVELREESASYFAV